MNGSGGGTVDVRADVDAPALQNFFMIEIVPVLYNYFIAQRTLFFLEHPTRTTGLCKKPN